MKKNKVDQTYIVVYTLETIHWIKDVEEKRHVNYWQPFIEYDENETSPKDQAEQFYALLKGEEGFPENQSLYSASICVITESTDYPTKVKEE